MAADDFVHRAGQVTDADERRARRALTTRLVVGGVVAVVLLAFIFQNTDTATFSFLVFNFQAGLWLMLLVTLGLGVLLGWGGGHLLARRRSRRSGHAER
jgi:uncharacterized integral membrane protein